MINSSQRVDLESGLEISPTAAQGFALTFALAAEGSAEETWGAWPQVAYEAVTWLRLAAKGTR